MRLLLVEDDPTYLAELTERLSQINGMTLVVAKSRDAAMEYLNGDRFDLIVSDLRIPTRDGELDLEVEHGESVVAVARGKLPGTPIIILSAFGTIPRAVELVRGAPRRDLIGDRVEDVLVDYLTKGEVDQCIVRVEQFTERLRQTDVIEVRPGVDGWTPTPDEGRVIKVFARRLEGRFVQVRRMVGGFSDTSTFRARIEDRRGRLTGLAFGKVGPLDVIASEVSRFERFVSPMLPVGSFAVLQHHVQGGAGSAGGVFYQLAEDAPSLFALMQGRPEQAGVIVHAVAERVRPWHEGASSVHEITVDELRGMVRLGLLDPAGMPGGRDWSEFGQRTIPVRRAVQHGDLHGDNVLVYRGDQTVLIDYAEVGELVTGYDPVVLELSLLFHPSGNGIRRDWPSPAQAEHWFDLASYLRDCPVADFVRACRDWALGSCPSDRTVAACAYVYAERQLRYPDTDKELVRAVMTGAANRL
jgi:CheY-like chemotaxis protein